MGMLTHGIPVRKILCPLYFLLSVFPFLLSPGMHFVLHPPYYYILFKVPEVTGTSMWCWHKKQIKRKSDTLSLFSTLTCFAHIFSRARTIWHTVILKCPHEMVLHPRLLILASPIPDTAQLDPWHMALIFVTLPKRKYLRPNVQKVIKCAYNFLLTFVMNIETRTFTWASSVLPQSLRYLTSFAWNQQCYFYHTSVYTNCSVF